MKKRLDLTRYFARRDGHPFPYVQDNMEFDSFGFSSKDYDIPKELILRSNGEPFTQVSSAKRHMKQNDISFTTHGIIDYLNGYAIQEK